MPIEESKVGCIMHFPRHCERSKATPFSLLEIASSLKLLAMTWWDWCSRGWSLGEEKISTGKEERDEKDIR
jgi:hypothetical protein